MENNKMNPRTRNRIILAVVLLLFLIASYFLSGTKDINPLEPEISEDTLEEKEEEVDEEEELVSEEDKEKLKEKNIPIPKVSKEEVEKIKEDQKKEKDKIVSNDSSNKGKKDKYMTDPVAEGKPKPVEWQDVKIDKSKPKKATLSITCKSILNNMHLFNMDKLDVLPSDGIIYGNREVTFYEGESVFDLTLREVQKNNIHMEFQMTPVYNSHYIQGINNLYEFDCGELSGWMYRVNGWFPNYGVSRYVLEDGDKIELIYTCDLGRDIGGGGAVGGN